MIPNQNFFNLSSTQEETKYMMKLTFNVFIQASLHYGFSKSLLIGMNLEIRERTHHSCDAFETKSHLIFNEKH